MRTLPPLAVVGLLVVVASACIELRAGTHGGPPTAARDGGGALRPLHQYECDGNIPGVSKTAVSFRARPVFAPDGQQVTFFGFDPPAYRETLPASPLHAFGAASRTVVVTGRETIVYRMRSKDEGAGADALANEIILERIGAVVGAETRYDAVAMPHYVCRYLEAPVAWR